MTLKTFIILFTTLIFSCESTPKKNGAASIHKAECIKNIMARDDSLGTIRNHICTLISLSEAIEQYIASIRQLKFTHCPPELTRAFQKHMQAWAELQAITDYYPELRGEMHDLFDTLSGGKHNEAFGASLQKILDTWDEVEKVRKATSQVNPDE